LGAASCAAGHGHVERAVLGMLTLDQTKLRISVRWEIGEETLKFVTTVNRGCALVEQCLVARWGAVQLKDKYRLSALKGM
jgi:hypothetical protein